jgi:hypothetical protein
LIALEENLSKLIQQSNTPQLFNKLIKKFDDARKTLNYNLFDIDKIKALLKDLIAKCTAASTAE